VKFPAVPPANQNIGTRFIDHGGTQGWVDLVGLVTYPPEDGHRSEYYNNKQLATDSIAARHASFNRIRQVAPVCIPSNTRYLLLKKHLDRFSRPCSAHSLPDSQTQIFIFLQWFSVEGHSSKVSLSVGSSTRSDTWFLRPNEPTLHTPNQFTVGSAVFAEFTRVSNTQTTLYAKPCVATVINFSLSNIY